MSVVQLDFFAADDLNGSVLLSIDDQDDFFEGLAIRPSLKDLGVGKLTVSRKIGAAVFDNGAFQPEVFVRVLIPAVSETKYLWGFFLDLREQVLISTDEAGGEKFEIGGPGPAFYLARAILWDEQFSGSGWRIDTDNGVFVFDDDTAGNVLSVLINEDQANTIATFLPDLTDGFSSATDSAGNAWGADYELPNDFELHIGDDYLENIHILQDACPELDITFDLGVVGTPIFKLDAWQGYGRDLSGGDFEADVVLFKEAVNIETELVASGTALRFASHALVKGADGSWGRAVRTSWDPGEFVKAITYDYSRTANENLLERAGLRMLRAQEHNDNEFDFEITPGFDEDVGHYFPGPEGTDGHFWLGDTITLTTGGDVVWTPLDYRYEEQRVTGLTMELREAAKDDTDAEAALSWTIRPQLNVERGSDNRASNGQGGGGRHTYPPNPRLCPALTPGEETALRFYFSDNAAAVDLSAVPDAAWEDTDEISGTLQLYTTPQGSFSGGAFYDSADGILSVTSDVALIQSTYSIDSSLAAILAAGGATVRMQMKGSARFGIGISEVAQDIISQLNIRVTEGASTTIRGTALATHSLASSAGSNKWPPSATEENRVFPAAAATNTLSAVSGAAAGDLLVVEAGYRNFNTTSASGGAIHPRDGSATDLPEDEVATNEDNSWLEIRSITSPSGSGNHPDLVGTSARAARCDHKHHVVRERAPGVTDDSTQGYPVGTFWVYVDDEESPTEILATYLLVDDTEGAAVWLLQEGSGSGGGTTLTIEEEDGTPSEEFDTLKVPNGSLTDNGDGSASLAFPLVGHVHSAGEEGASIDGAFVSTDTPQAIATGTITALSYSAETFDTNDYWDSGQPTRITIPEDGWYEFHAQFRWGTQASFNTSTGQQIAGRFRIDGDDTANTSFFGDDWNRTIEALSTGSVNAHGFHYLEAGQYVEMTVYQNSGESLNAPGEDVGFGELISRLFVRRVRDGGGAAGGRWEVVVDGSPPEAVYDTDDWLYSFVED